MYTSTVQFSPASTNAALLPHVSKPPFPHLPIMYLLPLPSHHRLLLLAFLLRLLPPLPTESVMVLQWNAGGLRARSTELLLFLSSHPVDLICIQESNLNSSSFFRIPGYSALRSDCTHSRSGILSSYTTHANGSVVIFVRQDLSFSELFTSSLSSLDPYSDYVEINISLNNSSALSLLNVSLNSSLHQKSLRSGGLQLPSHPLRLESYFRTPRRGSIRLVISSDLLPFNDPDTPTLLHRSTGSRSSPDISFAPVLLFFLAPRR